MLNLFDNNETIVQGVKKDLQALQEQGVTITDKVIKMTVRDIVRKQCLELKFLEVLQKVEKILRRLRDDSKHTKRKWY